MKYKASKNRKRGLVPNVKCPNCGARQLHYDGYGIGRKYKVKRRFLCLNCNKRTVSPIRI